MKCSQKQVWVFQMNLFVSFVYETCTFPKASFGNSIVSNSKYALTDPFLWELWRIISIATLHTQCFGHSKYFVCEFCCKTSRFFGSLKNHYYWIHASEIWLYAKASFGTSNVSNAKNVLWSQEAHFSQPGQMGAWA